MIFLAGSGFLAGPFTTAPSAMANWLPWQGQLMVPPSTVETVQPWWVQIAENALNVPALGWVITRAASGRMTPPPTGTSAVAASFPDAAARPPPELLPSDCADGAGAGAAWPVP